MANGADQLDTRIEIITPENIAFQYRVAGPFRRLPAYGIDFIIRWGIIFVALILLRLVQPSFTLTALGMGLTLLILFFLSWFYGGVFETFWNGQTPGKRAMRIRVVSVDGQPISAIQAILRNFLLIVDSMPPFVFHFDLPPMNIPIAITLQTFQVGLLAAMMNDRFQRLGDLAAGTMVVVEEGHWLRGLAQLRDPEITQLAARLPANFIAKRSLARALSAYVERRGTFAWGRRMEIARHLAEPLREKFDLPPGTNLDLLLCALYYRTFITDRQEDEPIKSGSPFAEAKSPFAAVGHDNMALTNQRPELKPR
jgi:uncharacterized RDD family membrane protein YckC